MSHKFGEVYLIVIVVQRGSYGEERYERLDFQRVVQQQFERLREEDQRLECASAGAPSWVVVDAERSIEDVHTEVLEAAERIVHLVGDEPIQKLWMKNDAKNA
jgi:dTMP kinase